MGLLNKLLPAIILNSPTITNPAYTQNPGIWHTSQSVEYFSYCNYSYDTPFLSNLHFCVAGAGLCSAVFLFAVLGHVRLVEFCHRKQKASGMRRLLHIPRRTLVSMVCSGVMTCGADRTWREEKRREYRIEEEK